MKKNSTIRNKINARDTGSLLNIMLIVLVLAVGIFITVLLIALKKPPEKKEQEIIAPLVKTQKLIAHDIQMVIHGNGTVRPKVEVELIPEVGGKIVEVHPGLKAGGFIPADETILKIDPSDYEFAVQQALAAVAEAQVRVDTEIAEAEVARQEWKELQPGTEPSSPLVLREPQIKQAKAMLDSAKAQLSTAQLRLERTELSLPYDAMIVSESVDLGQFINVGQRLGTAYGIDAFEIEVPLEDKDLAWFDIFSTSLYGRNNNSEERITAEVIAEFAGDQYKWTGYVTRTTGLVDNYSRMVPIIIEVPRPMEVSGDRPPLLPGAFTKVNITGKVLANAIAVPRDVIRQGNQIWIVNDNSLYIKSLKIARADKEYAYVTSGLDKEVLVVVSSLDAVIDGMEVRTENEPEQTPTDIQNKSDKI